MHRSIIIFWTISIAFLMTRNLNGSVTDDRIDEYQWEKTYLVDMSQTDKAFVRLFGISNVIDLTGTGDSSFCYFELHIPVENRTYLSMPFTVTQTDDFDYTGAEWTMLPRRRLLKA